tara:strand:+ start:136 stop:396 length:261 start_codon:yes stop_codon:yes gene_type:complete
MKHRSKMTQLELNALTDKSLQAYVVGSEGQEYYVEPENGRFFERYEIRLVVGDNIKITVGANNMLVLEDEGKKFTDKLIIRKDQIK